MIKKLLIVAAAAALMASVDAARAERYRQVTGFDGRKKLVRVEDTLGYGVRHPIQFLSRKADRLTSRNRNQKFGKPITQRDMERPGFVSQIGDRTRATLLNTRDFFLTKRLPGT